MTALERLDVGDPVCWLGQVCDDCGLLDEPVGGRCRRCGSPLVSAPDVVDEQQGPGAGSGGQG